MTQRPASDPVPPAFARLGPGQPPSPLVVAVPHAGRHYPPAIEAARAVGWNVLAQLEDRYVDRLIGPLLAEGAVAIVANVARAWIDLNRAGDDLVDTVGASARARAGLGVVPTELGGRRLWRSNPSAGSVAARVAQVHAPYHAALAAALAQARAAHGVALLIDAHSMPPLGRGPRSARLVIGDLHGASAGAAVSRAALLAAGASGLAAARNAPYAGAYTLERHGRPEAGIHALQVELDRSLYLDSAGEPMAAGVGRCADRLAAIARAACAAAFPQAIAAE